MVEWNEQKNLELVEDYAEAMTRAEYLEATNIVLVNALERAKFRLFGAGPSTDPLYAIIRGALNLAKEKA